MEERFLRNIPALSQREQMLLGEKHVLLIGCGGLGGTLLELLARAGVGEITAVDGDVFTESNLNRQILCTEQTLGRSKVAVAEERIRQIAPGLRFHGVAARFDADNAASLVRGKDLVLDALDSVPSRLLLEDACGAPHVTLVHGAVSEWRAQVAVVPPGSGLLHRLYRDGQQEQSSSVLSFAPAYCASIQAAQAVLLLTGRQSPLEGRLLLTDLQDMESHLLAI